MEFEFKAFDESCFGLFVAEKPEFLFSKSPGLFGFLGTSSKKKKIIKKENRQI